MKLSLFTHLLYPKNITCIICGGELPALTRYGVCPDCRIEQVFNCCQICGCQLDGNKQYCDSCAYENRPFEEARAPFCFDNDSVRRIVYAFKYGDKTYLAQYMAEFMADVYYKQNWLPDFITYVPVHRLKKLFVRGYDQAELLAKRLSEIINLPYAALLTKTKFASKNAAKLGKKDRKIVLKDSFTANDGVKGKNILLIDDVFTSGATTEECTKALKAAGAKRIWVLTFATSREKPQTYSLEDGDKTFKKFIKSRR